MKKNKGLAIICLTSLLALGLASCKDEEMTAAPDDNNRVFYEIFTGSFSDSNKDGIGDLKGITNRLDYLNNGRQTKGDSLGVQGIWLTPIFQGNSYHKYDTVDYYKIDSQFGSNDDLKKLLDEAHKRGIKIIIDLVINHTSTSNQWFRNFEEAHNTKDTSSKWYNFYSWTTTPSGEKKYQSIGSTNQYYECNFDSSMPELNYDNEEVREEMLKVAKYWIDFGVDGFRFDAAKYIYYGDNQKSASFWDWYCKELKDYKNDIYTVAEVWDSDGVTDIYYPYVNCFNFTLSGGEGLISDVANGHYLDKFTKYVSSYNSTIKSYNSDALMCTFQSNHDQNRVSSWIINQDNYKMAANIYLLTPGSPFVYYGEEIEMKGSRGSENTDANRRLAMLWGDRDTIKDPTGANYYEVVGLKNKTVKQNQKDSNSVLNHYKKVIALRNKYLQIGRGDYEAIVISSSDLGGFKITYNDEVTALIHNNTYQELSINIKDIGDYSSIVDYVGINKAKLKDGVLTLEAYTSVLLK